MKFTELEPSVWSVLQRETRPIVLYGMGDGADKILQQFDSLGISISAVFASDEFVRGHSFHQWKVQRLSDIIANYGEDIVIIIAFATHRPEVIQKIFSLDETYTVAAPDVPVVGDTIFDSDFIRRHEKELEQAYRLLADEQSRAVFHDIIQYKLSGKLQYLRRCESDKNEAFKNILRPHEREHFVDLGAYRGDTIQEFLHYTNGAFSSITAFEPDQKTFRKLSQYAEPLGAHVNLVQAGAWSSDTTLIFAAKAGRQSRVASKGIAVPMRSLDNVLSGGRCTLLKMDIEGAEREAIQGATFTIQKYRPKLNIAVYHRSEDIFAIPLQLHALCPTYRFYLRHHPAIPAWDTNLYAVYDDES